MCINSVLINLFSGVENEKRPSIIAFYYMYLVLQCIDYFVIM